MKKNYAVLTAVEINGKRTEPGGIVTLEDADAAPLLGVKAVEESSVDAAPVVPADPAERQAAIVEAIGLIDPNNSDLWLRDGKPDAATLSEILGWNVSAAERNTAWDQVKPAA